MLPDPHAYCRDVEAYLCRKNDGHLIRIVGPAFEQVCGWARRGIPLKVVFHGIDRCFDRYYARGQRRWPVRIEFCENDVLDIFDEWRRAVGIQPAVLEGASPEGEAGARTSGKPGLQKHLERLVDRLTALRATHPADAEFGKALDRALDELESIRVAAKGTRGEARTHLVVRLQGIEQALLHAATESLDGTILARIDTDAARELGPFRERMDDEAYRDAFRRSAERLIRMQAGLPQIRFD